MPKTSNNAAKIYQRLIQNGEAIHGRFEGTKCEQFLQILAAKLDEESRYRNENP
jgi:hypothetical protein